MFVEVQKLELLDINRQIVLIPSSLQAFVFDATLGCLLLLQQVQSDAS